MPSRAFSAAVAALVKIHHIKQGDLLPVCGFAHESQLTGLLGDADMKTSWEPAVRKISDFFRYPGDDFVKLAYGHETPLEFVISSQGLSTRTRGDVTAPTRAPSVTRGLLSTAQRLKPPFSDASKIYVAGGGLANDLLNNLVGAFSSGWHVARIFPSGMSREIAKEFGAIVGRSRSYYEAWDTGVIPDGLGFVLIPDFPGLSVFWPSDAEENDRQELRFSEGEPISQLLNYVHSITKRDPIVRAFSTGPETNRALEVVRQFENLLLEAETHVASGGRILLAKDGVASTWIDMQTYEERRERYIRKSPRNDWDTVRATLLDIESSHRRRHEAFAHAHTLESPARRQIFSQRDLRAFARDGTAPRDDVLGGRLNAFTPEQRVRILTFVSTRLRELGPDKFEIGWVADQKSLPTVGYTTHWEVTDGSSGAKLFLEAYVPGAPTAEVRHIITRSAVVDLFARQFDATWSRLSADDRNGQRIISQLIAEVPA